MYSNFNHMFAIWTPFGFISAICVTYNPDVILIWDIGKRNSPRCDAAKTRWSICGYSVCIHELHRKKITLKNYSCIPKNQSGLAHLNDKDGKGQSSHMD